MAEMAINNFANRSLVMPALPCLSLPKLPIGPVGIALGFAGMLTLIFCYAILKIPAPAEPIAVEKPQLPADTQSSVIEKRQDRVRQIELTRVATDPVPVVTERILPSDASAIVPPVAVVQEEEDKPTALQRGRHKNAGADICSRHGMRKEMTRGGKSWRCRL